MIESRLMLKQTYRVVHPCWCRKSLQCSTVQVFTDTITVADCTLDRLVLTIKRIEKGKRQITSYAIRQILAKVHERAKQLEDLLKKVEDDEKAAKERQRDLDDDLDNGGGDRT